MAARSVPPRSDAARASSRVVGDRHHRRAPVWRADGEAHELGRARCTDVWPSPASRARATRPQCTMIDTVEFAGTVSVSLYVPAFSPRETGNCPKPCSVAGTEVGMVRWLL